MEQFHNALEMLDLMTQPAFCVRDGSVIKTNPAAAAFLIETGTKIASMLHTGAEEYAHFSAGCLYLTLSLGGQSIGASVSRMQDFDVFCIEQEHADSHLQAMALAARELRVPLANVMTVADRLLPEAAGSDPLVREQISHLNRSLFQMLRIISNMSDAGLYAADTGTRQEIRNICSVLEEVFQRASVLTEQTSICVNYTGCQETIYTLLDAQKLERMVFNILSNAIKFTPAGGHIDAALTRRGNKLYLSIQDSGSGISENLKGTLFSRYLRQPGLEDSRHGLGLGMVLIRSTAALHGGTVLIDQPEGCGTRVTVSFAIRQNDTTLRSPGFRIDYAGERDHGLIELSDVLPVGLYDPDSVN